MRDLLPPKQIPDLSDVRAHGEWFAIQRGLHRGGSQDHSAYVLQANAIRLADAAVRDYLLGGHSIAQHHGRAMRSEEHTSELQSLMRISYAVFCLKKKKY